MILRFFTLAVVFLLSCSEFERGNPFDNYGKEEHWDGLAEIEEVKFKFSDPRDKKIYDAIEFRITMEGNSKYGIAGIDSNITWMAQNLNWDAPAGSVCYGNDETNCATYGRLYDFETAKTACPSGWRLPVEGEEKLATYEYYDDGRKWENDLSNRISEILGYESCYKITEDNHCVGRWIVGLGGRYSNGKFNDIDAIGYWWTSTDGKEGKANSIHGQEAKAKSTSPHHTDRVDIYGKLENSLDDKSSFLSVRCVQD